MTGQTISPARSEGTMRTTALAARPGPTRCGRRTGNREGRVPVRPRAGPGVTGPADPRGGPGSGAGRWDGGRTSSARSRRCRATWLGRARHRARHRTTTRRSHWPRFPQANRPWRSMGADLKNAHVVGLKWAEASNGRQVGHVFGRRSARSIARRTMRLARPRIWLRRLLPCIALTCENMPSQVHPGQVWGTAGRAGSNDSVWRHAKVQEETRRKCILCHEIGWPRCIRLCRATAGNPGVLCHAPPEGPVLCGGSSPRPRGHTSCTHRPPARSRAS